VLLVGFAALALITGVVLWLMTSRKVADAPPARRSE
jgi:hypothetical protein